MCTVVGPAAVMVCDVSRDKVRHVVEERLGDGAGFEVVHGEGTLVTLRDPEHTTEFRQCVEEALGWTNVAWGSV